MAKMSRRRIRPVPGAPRWPAWPASGRHHPVADGGTTALDLAQPQAHRPDATGRARRPGNDKGVPVSFPGPLDLALNERAPSVVAVGRRHRGDELGCRDPRPLPGRGSGRTWRTGAARWARTRAPAGPRVALRRRTGRTRSPEGEVARARGDGASRGSPWPRAIPRTGRGSSAPRHGRRSLAIARWTARARWPTIRPAAGRPPGRRARNATSSKSCRQSHGVATRRRKERIELEPNTK